MVVVTILLICGLPIVILVMLAVAFWINFKAPHNLASDEGKKNTVIYRIWFGGAIFLMVVWIVLLFLSSNTLLPDPTSGITMPRLIGY